MELNYSGYLNLGELLSLQKPASKGKAHDEMLFIIIHQVYELWFKEILHELDQLQEIFRAADAGRASQTLKRVIAILKVLIAQLDVLETMLPLQFLAFRNLLGTASGLQSAQFREVEFALGLKRHSALLLSPEGSEPRRRLEQRYEAESVWDSFLRFLAKSGYPAAENAANRDKTGSVRPSEAVQEILERVYREDPAITSLCELLLDLDESFLEWRHRHMRMVERMIGNKQGTGGTSGVEFLAATLSHPFFPDLWAVRTRFERHDYR